MIAFIEIIVVVAFILDNSACIILINLVQIRIQSISNILGWRPNSGLNFYGFVIHAKTMVDCLQQLDSTFTNY